MRLVYSPIYNSIIKLDSNAIQKEAGTLYLWLRLVHSDFVEFTDGGFVVSEGHFLGATDCDSERVGNSVTWFEKRCNVSTVCSVHADALVSRVYHQYVTLAVRGNTTRRD